MRVRRAVAGDAAALLGSMHALAVFEGYDADFRVGEADLLARGLTPGGAPPQFTALVAEGDRGALCGHAVLLVTPFTYDLRPTAVLKELCVDAAHRGRGVGEALLAAVQAEAGATGGRHYIGGMTKTTMLSVKVKPNARESRLDVQADGSWLAQLKSPPVDGRANEELIALVARHFGCRKAQVLIKSGAGARLKLLQVTAD